MKSQSFKAITDAMIGRDDKICNCASKVAEIIASCRDSEKKTLKDIMGSIKKGTEKR